MTANPLKAKPLRTPGQSVSDDIQRLMDDKVLPTMLFVGAPWVVTLVEWLGAIRNVPRSPLWYTVISLAVTGSLSRHVMVNSSSVSS